MPMAVTDKSVGVLLFKEYINVEILVIKELLLQIKVLKIMCDVNKLL